MPKTLKAYVDQTETEVEITWQSESAYDPNTFGNYVFTAILPEGYILSQGVELPKINVGVYMGIVATSTAEVDYVDENGVSQTAVTATKIESNTTNLTSGWYYATGDVTINNNVIITGDVKIILTDGCTLTIQGTDYNPGINVGDNSLTIYGQSNCTGKLKVTGGKGAETLSNYQWIHGDPGLDGINVKTGSISINGGIIEAKGGTGGYSGWTTSGRGGSGIGTTSGDIIINRGFIIVNAGQSGNGYYIAPKGYDITFSTTGTNKITGGTITANYGDISGGQVIIDGGSLKTQTELSNAKNSLNESLCLLKINLPDTVTSIKNVIVEDTDYKIDKLHDEDNTMYLYLPTNKEISIKILDQSDTTHEFIANYSSLEGYTFITNDITIIENGKYGMSGLYYVNTQKIISCAALLGTSITVNSNVTDVTFLGVNTTKGLTLSDNTNLTLTIEGANYFGGGITVPQSSSLTIEGDGELTAIGNQDEKPGIGGANGQPNGKIIINSGTINASTKGTNAPGIGSGGTANQIGDIIINGGIVNATGGQYSSDIGARVKAGNIIITGGTVTATGQFGIGTGSHGSAIAAKLVVTGGSIKTPVINKNPTKLPTNNDNEPLYLGKLTDQTGVTSVSVDDVSYSIDANHPEGDNSLYLYMTGENHDVDVQIGGSTKRYKATWVEATKSFTFDGVTTGSTVNTSVTVSTVKVPFGTQTATVTATVNDSSIQSRTKSLNQVEFSIDGKVFSNSKVINGVATAFLDTSKLDIGEYDFTAEYGGSFGGNISTGTGKLIICAARPIATIDYINEKLTGLVNGNYKFNNGVEVAVTDGTYPINTSWIGTSLSIIKTNADEKYNSLPQTLSIPARAATPSGTPVATTVGSDTSHTKLSMDTKFEYKVVADGTIVTINDIDWVDGGNNLNIEVDSTTVDVYVRTKTTNTSFKSDVYKALDSVTVKTISVDVTAPVAGAAPQGTLTLTTGYMGTIRWNEALTANNKFKAGTVYTATIKLTAGTDYKFVAAAEMTVVNAESISVGTIGDSGKTLTATATFAKTEDIILDHLVGSATITGVNKIGETLTANTSTVSGGNGDFIYQWKANGVTVGSNSSTYTISANDLGKIITCVITRDEASGSVTDTFDSGKVVPYTVIIKNIGNVGNDKGVSLSAGTGRENDLITLNYVLSKEGTKSNTLSFTGGTGLVSVSSAGDSTSQNYTVKPSDAVNGLITITATFQHSNLTEEDNPNPTPNNNQNKTSGEEKTVKAASDILLSSETTKIIRNAIKNGTTPAIDLNKKYTGADFAGVALLENSAKNKNVIITNGSIKATLTPKMQTDWNVKENSTVQIILALNKNTANLNGKQVNEIYNLAVMSDGKSIEKSSTPIKITIDTSALKLTEQQKANFTGVIYNANLKANKQLGGEFSADGKSFSFYSYNTGNVGVIISNKITKINLKIDNKSYTVNGKKLENDVAPIIINGRTMLPVRAITEALGAEVIWDPKRMTVIIKKDGKTFEIPIDQPLPDNMGEAFIQNGRTFVPVRYIAEKLDANIVWNENNKTVDIYK